MKVRLRNLLLALWHQGPPRRFIRNFLVTGNAWGMFSRRSHERQGGTAKVTYGSPASADKAAERMTQKHGMYFSRYKCIFCDGWHLGKNRENK